MDLSDDALNKNILKTFQISSQENILLTNIEKFYKEDINKTEEAISIIKGESIISMRLIDYFVTNYSKKYRTCYKIKVNNVNENFNVFASYKSQLKAYNKKYFDPFSRGNRLPFFFKEDCIITTIGQLNFFKWFFKNNIHTYIKENLSKIEEDLLENKSNLKKKVKVKKNNKKKYIEKAPDIIHFQKLPKQISKIQLIFD